MPKGGRETPARAVTEAPPPLVTVMVMKGTEATSVKVDPSKYGFLSIQLQDEAYAQQFVNTDEVIADLSEAALGPELAADIATTLDVADGRVTVTDVRLAAQTLRGADYLQLRGELYLEQVVTVLKQAAAAEDSDVPPTSAAGKEVVPCVHTGQLMWDRLGAYTVLRLEQKGIISLGHNGIINARDERIDDELLALANVLNDVTSLDISFNKSITACEPFADTLVELNARDSSITDEGLKLCTKIWKLDVSFVKGVTSCAPFADSLEELDACWRDTVCSGISDVSLHCCRKIRKLAVDYNPKVTTCDPFAPSLTELDARGVYCGIADASLHCCRNIRRIAIDFNHKVASCAPFADTLEELDARGLGCEMTSDAIQRCTKLRKLDVRYNPRVTTCDTLKHLEELRPSPGFTAASLQEVAENCPQLRSLRVRGLKAITDTAIIALAENCPYLEYLDVARTSKITDASIKKVAEHCPRLQVLDVTDTGGNITDASIAEIVKKCPLLAHLNPRYTGGKVSGDALKRLLPSSRSTDWREILDE